MKYIVNYTVDDETFSHIMVPNMIFALMDHEDCIPIRLNSIHVSEPGAFYLAPCRFYGLWHNAKDPLRMEIRLDNSNELLDVGYGVDH